MMKSLVSIAMNSNEIALIPTYGEDALIIPDSELVAENRDVVHIINDML